MVDAKEQTSALQEKPYLDKWQHVIALGAVSGAILFGAIRVSWPLFTGAAARLDTEFLAEVVIADLTHRPTGKLQLSYEKETLESASTISLLVTNTGRTNLTPRNDQALGDLRNARISITLETGIRILEATAQPIGQDASSNLVQLESSEQNVATFVVRLMNVDAQVKVDLVVAGVDVAGTLAVEALGEGVKGEFLHSKRNVPTILVVVTTCLAGAAGGHFMFVLLSLTLTRRVLRGEEDARTMRRIRQDSLYLASAGIVPFSLLFLLPEFGVADVTPFAMSACLVFLLLALPIFLWSARRRKRCAADTEG